MSEPAVTLLAGTYGDYPNGTVTRVVIHDEEFPVEVGSALSIAQDFANRRAPNYGSAGYVTDQGDEQHCVPDSKVAYHAPPNQGSVGQERDGYASYNPDQWNHSDAQRTTCNVAARTAELLRRFGLPPVWLTVGQLAAGGRGVTSHNNVSLCWGQSDHHDPGPAFPIGAFMALVTRAYNLLGGDVRVLQRTLGTPDDGDFGRGSVLALGGWLHGNAPAPGPAPAPAPKPPTHLLGDLPLSVDGSPGQETWGAVQRAVGAAVDGIPGPATWMRVQQRVGVAQDGVPGLVTWAAVQRHVGATPDGDPGPQTWAAIQTALNARRF